MEYSPKILNDLMNNKGFRFKKSFGQNFIIDENVINSIVNKCDIDKDTLVLEIGPGSGALTYKLSEVSKWVLCYEIDEGLKGILDSNLGMCNNVDVIYKDFLKGDIKMDLKKYEYDKLYVVSNLPYYITTPIIIKFIDDKILVDKIVIMVQKEVGNRFEAKPGSRSYGSLSVFLNYYFDIRKIMDVSRNVFMPKPNVDSIVVEFRLKSKRLEVLNEDIFFKLIRDSFKQKRKTIRNNLMGWETDEILKVLQTHNMDLSVRAEQISVDIFVEMANAVFKLK